MIYSKNTKKELSELFVKEEYVNLAELSRIEGIPESTLRDWRDKARAKVEETGSLGDFKTCARKINTKDKFQIVLETSSLTETELAEYARKKGLFVEQIKDWKESCEQANTGTVKNSRELTSELRDSEKRIKELEKELKRKEKALAETAALLVLRKKANAIWGDGEDE